MDCKSQYQKNNYFSVFIITAVILFFYGAMMVIPSYKNLNIFFDLLKIKLRWVFLFYFLFIFCVQTFFLRSKKEKVLNKFLNSYFLIFLFVMVFSNFFQKKEEILKDINQIKNSPILINPINTIQKPVILIITDEYASPDEIYKILKDSSVYNYSNNLKKEGWIIKNHFYSYETHTIKSLSSMFNFNLSRSKDYLNQPDVVIERQKLSKCSLYDSINKKNCEIINLGIFDFGAKRAMDRRMYYCPINFEEQFFLYTTFGLYNSVDIDRNMIDLYPKHNEFNFNKINDTIKKEKTFLYSHFILPHPPFSYNKEFKFREISTEAYIDYWNFANIKLYKFLKILTKENKYRIIVTGDHGFRREKKNNPHNTYTAFWGFDEGDIKKMRSVQDLGSLINGYIF